MLNKIAIAQVCWHTSSRGMGLKDEVRLLQASQFMANGGGAIFQTILAHKSLRRNRGRGMDIFFNQNPQDLLLTLTQWCHQDCPRLLTHQSAISHTRDMYDDTMLVNSDC